MSDVEEIAAMFQQFDVIDNNAETNALLVEIVDCGEYEYDVVNGAIRYNFYLKDKLEDFEYCLQKHYRELRRDMPKQADSIMIGLI